MTPPWGELYLSDEDPPSAREWAVVTGALGSAGWELVCAVEDRREQRVTGNEVAGVLVSWTETYKRPASSTAVDDYELAKQGTDARRLAAEAAERAAAEQLEAEAAHRRRVLAEAPAAAPSSQKYIWISGDFACSLHRQSGCSTCGPPTGYRQRGESWVRSVGS